MLTKMLYGIAPDEQPFQLITLTNQNGMSIQLMDWGATWISCKVPVKGEQREILLGCHPEDYARQTAYLGASVGRYANRIANAEFTLNGKKIRLTANQGKHQLHGGEGFDKRRWEVEMCGLDFVRFSLFSSDGDQGFTGNVNAHVTYHLTEDNAIEVVFEANTDQDTPLNLTNHAYFNLNNAESGLDIRSHMLQLDADYFLPVDNEGIPNSSLKAVQYTSFDFRQEKLIGLDFLQEEQALTKGYDHAFLLNAQTDKPCAILTALDRSVVLQVFTSQPALQVYTGNYLGGTPTRCGSQYADYSGIALETQALPDTPNHPEWQQYGGISKAGEPYRQWTKFQLLS